MKAVTYITENTIMKFLYNPKKTFLEGFVKEWLRFDSGTYQDYGKYVRFLKVAIRDNVSELYMQGYPWGTQKGCKDRPIGYIPETFGALLINAMCPRRESRWTS